MNLKERATALVRSTFLGFIIAVIAAVLVPEIRNELMLMYMALAGKNGVESAFTNKK